MTYSCEHCGKVFATNAKLYTHKNAYHKSPTVVLVNHDRHDSETPPNVNSKKRIVEDDEDNIPKRKRHMSDDEDSEISFDRPRDDDKSDDMSDDTMTPPSSPRLSPETNVIPTPKVKIMDSYKTLYLKCRKDVQSLLLRHKKLRKRFDLLKKESTTTKKLLLKQCEDEKNILKKQYTDRTNDLEQLLKQKYTEDCEKKLENLQQKHENIVNNLNNEYTEKINELEAECERKVRLLNDQIQAMQDDETENFNAISKAIFNCTSMDEIFKVQHLIETQQFEELLNKHLTTIQNLFLGLSFGIIPICNPQRSEITDAQRELVEKIQSAPDNIAKKELRNKRSDFTRLFTIISESLNLIRGTYNRYGSRDESN